MDLNLARHPGQKATPEALVRAVKRAAAILARSMAEETYLDGATAYTSPRAPALPLANGALDLRLPTGVKAATVFDHVESHYAERGLACHYLDASEQAWPSELAEEAQRRGYRAETCEVAVLERWSPSRAGGAVQVIPGRAAFGETRAVFERIAARAGKSGEIAQQNAAALMDQLDDARLDVFLARIDRRPAGLASVLTLGNIGVVIDFFADEGGPATDVRNTLADRVFDHCQRAQFEQVIATIDGDAARRTMFESLGFRATAAFTRFSR